MKDTAVYELIQTTSIRDVIKGTIPLKTCYTQERLSQTPINRQKKSQWKLKTEDFVSKRSLDLIFCSEFSCSSDG